MKEKGSCSALWVFLQLHNGTDGDGEALVNRASRWLKHEQTKHPTPGLDGLVCASKQIPSSSGCPERLLPLLTSRRVKSYTKHLLLVSQL